MSTRGADHQTGEIKNSVFRHNASWLRMFGALLVVFVAFPAFAAIEGTVTNGTTGKPSAGDEITLIELSQGMQEAAHTKTDNAGKFKFDVQNTGGGMPRLVRATHQGVNYFKMVPPGVDSANIQVYDVAKKVTGLSYNVETAFQSSGGTLEVAQFYVVRNSSSPARTQSGPDFEIALPEKASIQQSDVQAPGGQPIQTAPNPKGNGRYAFDYPLRPGETTFRIIYTLPYSGEMAFKPALLFPADQFAVITPQGITFKPASPAVFSSQPHQGGVNIQIANNVAANSNLAFTISGTGQMPDMNAADQGSGSAMGGGAPAGGRPGGGLGAPIDSPDPLTKYRWPILLGFAVIFLFGAFYLITHRTTRTHEAESVDDDSEQSVEDVTAPLGSAAAPHQRSDLLLEAMKEELFQLELDRQQGKLSPEEYSKAKEALDATLQRALSRKKTDAASVQSV